MVFDIPLCVSVMLSRHVRFKVMFSQSAFETGSLNYLEISV